MLCWGWGSRGQSSDESLVTDWSGEKRWGSSEGCREGLHHRTAKDCFDPREVPLGISGLLEKVVCAGFEKLRFHVVPLRRLC